MVDRKKSLRVLFTPVAESQCMDAYRKLCSLVGEERAEAWLDRLRTVLSEEAELLTLVGFNRPTVQLFRGHVGCHVLFFRAGQGSSDIWQVFYERSEEASRKDSLCVIGVWRMLAGGKYPA